jgi:hypothetical protein
MPLLEVNVRLPAKEVTLLVTVTFPLAVTLAPITSLPDMV